MSLAQPLSTNVPGIFASIKVSANRGLPLPLGRGSARPNPKMGAPDPENPLFLGFSVLIGGLRPWSQTMVSEGARPWGRGRSGDCESWKIKILPGIFLDTLTHKLTNPAAKSTGIRRLTNKNHRKVFYQQPALIVDGKANKREKALRTFRGTVLGVPQNFLKILFVCFFFP